MKIILAPRSASSNIVSFLGKYISADNDAVHSNEFLCSDGIRAAVNRSQVLIAVVDHQIVGCLRFYKRKTQAIISLYQFAIDEKYRGSGLLKQMLGTINDVTVEASCPTDSSLNTYYQKTGWKLSQEGKDLNRWVLEGV